MSYNRGSDGRPKGFGFSGFQLKRDRASQLPPPPSSAISKHGYSTMSAISQNALAASYGLPRKRSKTEEDLTISLVLTAVRRYFDEDDDAPPPVSTLEYIPAPGSPSYQPGPGESSEEDDPLDAFMAGIEEQVQKETTSKVVEPEPDKKKGIRDDIEEEDDEESYYRYMEENPMAGVLNDDSDNEIEYDEDGNPIAPKKSKDIDPLPPVDHSEIDYLPFEKNFYTVHEDISGLSHPQVEELRQKLGIKVTGPLPPNPVSSFAHFGFDEALLKAIRKSEYTQPTPIQAQAVPAALGGRDIIGIARTGSGKTAAFIWPMLVHIMDQKELQPGDGPIGLILAPTRELSQQIYTEAKKFGKVYNIQVRL
uniref:RNA helicase n=1 Tax=Timema poppense TaxID=170557 RepID=A0A7R9DTF8_TIMPO|nr:unnamed protein product [Timema poppensis]